MEIPAKIVLSDDMARTLSVLVSEETAVFAGIAIIADPWMPKDRGLLIASDGTILKVLIFEEA